ncbi:MAG: hypothetical protein LH632_10305 [Rhodoferax sp.]|nr:hypothetical protein [Rhodoferax sp.]
MNITDTIKSIAVVILALGGLVAAGGAQAQAVVTDPAHTQLTLTGWVKELIAQGQQYSKQIQQYQKQVQSYQQQIKQYEQQYVKGSAFKGKPGPRENFTERGLDDGVLERCGSQPAKNPVGPQQFTQCMNIVRTENRRFNALVLVLREVAKTDEALEQTYKERADIEETDQGALQANSNRILAIQTKLANDVQSAKTVMETYDALLRGLKEDQVRMANSALKKKGGLSDTAVQGVALGLALRAARSRER